MIETNLIPFTFTTGEVLASFYFDVKNKLNKEDFSPLTRGEFPVGLLQKYEDRLKGVKYLYTDFQRHEDADFTGRVQLANSPRFALHYARFVIQDYFRNTRHFVVSRNLAKDVEIWVPGTKKQDDRWRHFYCFTAKVQYARMTEGFELVISYDKMSRVLNQSVAQLYTIDKTHFVNVVYDGKVHYFKSEGFIVHRNEGNAYPVVNHELEADLALPLMPKPTGNKYLRVREKIRAFCNNYLFKGQLDNVIQIPQTNSFLCLSDEDISSLPPEASLIYFKNYKGEEVAYTDIKEGFRKSGPYAIANDKPLKIFFIYQAESGVKAKEFVLKALSAGALPDVYKGHPYYRIKPLHKAIHQSFTYDDDGDIVFANLDTAVDEVERLMMKKEIDVKYRYLGIYISPISKNSTSDSHYQIVYTGIKEVCIKHDVAVQGFFEQRDETEANIQYSFTNIYAAILGKIGGIPWSIKTNTPEDLIIGVGAYYSRRKGKRYLGSAFCFDGSGLMKEFACIEEKEREELVVKMKKALASFVTDNDGLVPNRIVIHFYKEMSEKDWRPIFKMLQEFNVAEVPVIVVTLNKTETKDILGFNAGCSDLMPLAGTYFKVGEKTWLLYNNTKSDQAAWESMANASKERGYHFPIKVRLDCRNADVLEDEKTVTDLIQQIFQLSRMFWKSVDQQNLPITIKYTSILAEFLPYFRYEEIPNPEFGCKTLWFL